MQLVARTGGGDAYREQACGRPVIPDHCCSSSHENRYKVKIKFCFGCDMLDIFHKPHIDNAILVVVPSAIERHVSSHSVRLTCTAYGVPFPNVTWTRLPATELVAGEYEGLLVSTNVTPATNTSCGGFVTSSIVLCDVQLTDAGRYRCSASNNVNKEAPVGSNSSWEFSLSITPRGNKTFFKFLVIEIHHHTCICYMHACMHGHAERVGIRNM